MGAKINPNNLSSDLHDVSIIRDAGLCMGCGICEGICPVEGAIQVVIDQHRQEYLPVVNYDVCTHCGHCLVVCPGDKVDFIQLEKEFLHGPEKDDRFGVYRKCYIGLATSNEIRKNSTSGGAVTALLIYALEKGIIDGALVLGMSDTNPLETKPFIARTPEEVISASGSKYCPSAIDTGLKDILHEQGRFAVVGLPCHIHAIRIWENHNPRLRTKLSEKLVLHLGLFCANNNTYLGTKYFLANNNIAPGDVREIRYRGEGWPGKIVVTKKDGTKHVIRRGTTEKKWYRKALFSSAFHYDFMLPRCLVCPDLTSELADVSFGDPWIREYIITEKIGKSLMIIRNEIGDQFITDALEERIIEVEEVPSSLVRRAQNYSFKEGVGARINLQRAVGRTTPDYGDRKFTIKYRDYFSYLRYLPSFFSYHKWTWTLIRLIAIIHYAWRIFISRAKSLARFTFRQFGLNRQL